MGFVLRRTAISGWRVLVFAHNEINSRAANKNFSLRPNQNFKWKADGGRTSSEWFSRKGFYQKVEEKSKIQWNPMKGAKKN
jgi:nicotinamide riboside kinase